MITRHELDVIHARCVGAVILNVLVFIWMLCALVDAPAGSLPYQVASVMWFPSAAAIPLALFTARRIYRIYEAKPRAYQRSNR